MRKATRRQWLKASLGLGAYGLLEGAGFWGRNVSHASVQPGAPSRFLRLYVPGGWSPFYQFCPFSPTEIEAIIPTASHPFGQDPVFYSASQVNNLDGSGNALDPVGFPRLRVPRTWNESALSVGQPADNNANGWAWAEHELWKYCSVVHGVDMGTMSHRSALISMLTGRATTNFSVPSLGSWVAASVGEVLGEQRPLGSVVLSRRLMMPSAGLGADGAPTRLAGIESLQNGWSEQLDQVWDGLRNRTGKPRLDYFGMETGTTLVSNDLEDLVSQRTRSLAGTTNAPTDAVFEELYNAFHDVSRGLANDVVDTVLQTPGIEHLVPAFWNQVGDGPLALKVNSESTVGSEWTPDFELALKLLKSGLTTSVAMHVDGIGQASLDTHLEGHALHYQRLRGTFDVIGRMLAEMAMTPLSNGKSLLDDTLVLVTSELGRTFPMSGSCDHWAYNSYLVAGGGVYPNRMCGGYDVDTGNPTAVGFPGLPVALLDMDGNTTVRVPTSEDMVYTALALFGIDSVAFSSNPSRVLGLLS